MRPTSSRIPGVRCDARPRLPIQVHPSRIEGEYAAALLRVLARVRAAWQPLIDELPSILEEAARERAGTRADSASSRARRGIKKAAGDAQRVIDTSDLDALARKFADRTQKHQKVELARQVKAATSVDPVFHDAELGPLVVHFVHENVALVKRIPRRLHGDLETMVTHAVSSGRLHKKLAKHIGDRFKMEERHARLIARDQIGKFHGRVNHHRQRKLGVKRFVWRSVGDERVRPLHEDYDGEEYDYDDPPLEDGEPVLPTEPVNCRCTAEPVFDDEGGRKKRRGR